MAGSAEPPRSPEPPMAIVASVCGPAVVTRVRRIFYVSDDEVDREYGPVELAFSDGTAVLFDAGADGEELAVWRGAWRDPFAEPLSEVNRLFVHEHGKWTAFDISVEPSPALLIGKPITGYDETRTENGKLTGVTLYSTDVRLSIETHTDELNAEFTKI